MNPTTSRSRWFLCRAARPAITSLAFGALVVATASCSVDLLPEKPVVGNTCQASSDCGTNGVCTNGACYSRTGTIDEVLLEIVPEASSPLAGISLLSMQRELSRGAPSRDITLSGPVTFPVQVQVNGEDLPNDCPYLKIGTQTVAARVQFVRIGAVGGVSVSGLSNGSSLTVTTEPNATSTSGFSKSVALVPGYYDIYAQPVASNNCQIPSKIWRGVEVARDGQLLWAPPATLELPTPLKLNGRVQRSGETLANWQVEVIDPQDGKVISTSARLGATTNASPFTNFEVMYQPLEYVPPQSAGPASLRGPMGLLIRLKPPKDAESTAPTVYYDLAGAVTGQININVSSLPTLDQLVTVSGQVRGANDGVKATVKFFSSFQLQGLPTAYGPAVTTDASGRYTARLFPGKYRVVIVPEGATDDGSAVPGASPSRPWALTEEVQTIGLDMTQTLDLMVDPIRSLTGVATAGVGGVPAQGATFEASPLIAGSSDVLRTVITPPISPARASVPINDDGTFTLALDPGFYDFALKPASASNFAWWILPSVEVLTAARAGGPTRRIDPKLFYPVPLGGVITVTLQDKTTQPLRNATVRAYARPPNGESVTQVGTARTDDMGRYQLALPPNFGSIDP